MTEPGLWVALHHPPPIGAHLSLPVHACAQHSQGTALLWAACGPETALDLLSAPPWHLLGASTGS